jgi:hypothetical protein
MDKYQDFLSALFLIVGLISVMLMWYLTLKMQGF